MSSPTLARIAARSLMQRTAPSATVPVLFSPSEPLPSVTRTRAASLSSLLLALDAAAVVVSMAVAFALHDALRGWVSFLEATPKGGMLAVFVAVALPVHVSLTALLGLHRSVERGLSVAALVVELVKLAALELAVLGTMTYLTQSVINRSVVALYLACALLLMFLARVALSRWWRFQHASGQAQLRLLVVGDAGTPAYERLRAQSSSGPWPDAWVGRLGDGPDRLGPLSSLAEVLRDEAIDRVVFLPPYHQPGEQLAALAACETVGVPALFALEFEQPLRARPRMGRLHDEPFVVFDVAPKRPELLALKHAFDFVFTAAGVVLLLPVFAGVALAVLVTMGRPVFFIQERAGLYGRRFRMLKFRTMVKDAESLRDELLAVNEMSGPVFKVTNDPRVTRLGAFLRQSSLDELPQLFNVLAGSMSLVGPRPLPIAEQEGIVGWHRRRLSMKPGLTGLWQVSGRSNVDFEGWMKLDLRYVDEWSLWNDFVLLLKTFPAVLWGRGAK